MGGSGSGNWYRWDTKTTTDSQNRFDIRYLHRHGLLYPGHCGTMSYSWGDEPSGAIGYRVYEDRIVLDYRYRPYGGEWEEIEETVWLCETPCHYGGYRKWFRCPVSTCGRRVAVLYGAGRYFACRHCYDLVYLSQRETNHERAARKSRKIIRKLGGDPYDDYYPDRPNYMHHRTYNRLIKEAEYYNALSWQGLIVFAKKHGAL